ncbi:MAG: dihydroxyacetone kinase subunit L [Verrucomicrobiales bacterium]|nr:dihydroxyacetone kinase subunit L [Verrucomicrobiales bacterium]
MSQTLSANDFIAMLRGAGATIREHAAELTRLDSLTGDGDHGTAMLRAMDAVEQAIAEHADAGPGTMLTKAGWAVMSAAGGSTGPLLGSFLMGMGATLTGNRPFDGPVVAAALRGGINQMHKQSKAQIGDRTMMDALLPAAAAMDAAAPDASPADLLKLAAAAAAAGAAATRGMHAKFGRARNLGDRVLGHADPGATSMALILAGFRDGVSPAAIGGALPVNRED